MNVCQVFQILEFVINQSVLTELPMILMFAMVMVSVLLLMFATVLLPIIMDQIALTLIVTEFSIKALQFVLGKVFASLMIIAHARQVMLDRIANLFNATNWTLRLQMYAQAEDFVCHQIIVIVQILCFLV